ncbi:piwi-like protein 2 [Protopterus annectens]|uniref:piwi-like protein 2 n=1 Tax=Protopterus annectens TaxID=7888 RepID=UPI001CF93E4B|nr:piwi-like protein 2 [Protopterus annectens]
MDRKKYFESFKVMLSDENTFKRISFGGVKKHISNINMAIYDLQLTNDINTREEPLSSDHTVASMMQKLGFETKSALFGRGTTLPLGRGVFGRGKPDDDAATPSEVSSAVPLATTVPAPPMSLATRLERPFLGRGSIFGRGEPEPPVVTLRRAFIGRGIAPLSASVSSSLPQLSKPAAQSRELLPTQGAPSSAVTGEVAKREPLLKKGSKGLPRKLAVNLIRIHCQNEAVYQYHVTYSPCVESMNMRFGMLKEHKSVTGDVTAFDGTILYLPVKLEKYVKSLLEIASCVV